MGLRGGFWKAAQFALAAVFILMGIYGGDMPLGALCASIVLGTMQRRTPPGHHRAAAGAALGRARAGGLRVTVGAGARSAYHWLVAVLVGWALLLVTLGRSTATLAAVLSACLALWLAAAGSGAARGRRDGGLRAG